MATALATGKQASSGDHRRMERTSHPGVYRRGGRYVAVYRRAGRQRKESARTFVEARALKMTREAEVAAERLGPTLHDHALVWVRRYNGLGRNSVRDHTRVEYERLLATYALRYFNADVRLKEIDRRSLRGFVSWLISHNGRRGRLRDRSIRNAVTPLRLCLEHAARKDLVDVDIVKGGLMVPRRRRGGPWHEHESRFFTRSELARLMAEIPDQWQPFFGLLASTGLRVSEAIGLKWSDLDLATERPYLKVKRSVVRGVIGGPKSRNGRRSIPIDPRLAAQLAALRMRADGDEGDWAFQRSSGEPLCPESVRREVLVPAADRAKVSEVGFYAFRHTCASLLIEGGYSPLRVQRWMGHHSAAYTFDAYGHLIDGELSPALDLERELKPEKRQASHRVPRPTADRTT